MQSVPGSRNEPCASQQRVEAEPLRSFTSSLWRQAPSTICYQAPYHTLLPQATPSILKAGGNDPSEGHALWLRGSQRHTHSNEQEAGRPTASPPPDRKRKAGYRCVRRGHARGTVRGIRPWPSPARYCVGSPCHREELRIGEAGIRDGRASLHAFAAVWTQGHFPNIRGCPYGVTRG